MRAQDAEVLVVGAGPAGSATAAWLAGAGRDVLLVDKARFPREKACGEFFSPGVVAALTRLGAIDAVTRLPHSRPLGMRVITQAGEEFFVSYSTPGRDGPSGGLAVDRSALDSALLDHARESGVRVIEGEQVFGPVVDRGQVTGVRVRRSGEEPRELRARFVVAADGANSIIARSLGLARSVRWPRRMGLAVHYEGVNLDGVGEMHVGGRSYCGIASVGGGLVSVGLAAPMGTKRAGEPAAQLFERLLSQLPSAAASLKGGRRVGPVRGVGPLARGALRSGGPGFLLVGDAAGFLDPFTGEGVHRALIGAELAGAAVERALERGDALPVGYERTRRVAFADKELVVFLVQLFLSRPGAFGYVLRRLGNRYGAGVRLSGVLGDYRPARSILTPGFVWGLLRP